MPRKNKRFKESAVKNTMAYNIYFNKYREMSQSMFKWTGVPDTVNIEFFENALFDLGKVLFFKDEVLGFLCLPCALSGVMDVYNIPVDRKAYANNGYNIIKASSDSVIIWNNLIKTPSKPLALYYAERLWKMDSVIDININAQKTPLFISCDETQKLTMQNLYMQYDGNYPVIFGNKNLSPNDLKVLTTQSPYVADKVQFIKQTIWNESLANLGITNLNVSKKERLLEDEIAKSQGGTIAMRNSRLLARQRACEEINKMFGLNMWCDYDEPEIEQENEAEPDGTKDKEGEVKEDE